MTITEATLADETGKVAVNLWFNQAYRVQQIATSEEFLVSGEFGLRRSRIRSSIRALNHSRVSTIGWDVDTLDWTGISETAISSAVVSNVRPGSIVLMHASVGAANTPESLWYSIAALKESGYSFSTVSNLLALAGYYTSDEEPIEEDYSDAILSEVINQVETGEKTISLTISDASDAENVREILANLAAMDVKATFFLNGLTDAIDQRNRSTRS